MAKNDRRIVRGRQRRSAIRAWPSYSRQCGSDIDHFFDCGAQRGPASPSLGGATEWPAFGGLLATSALLSTRIIPAGHALLAAGLAALVAALSGSAGVLGGGDRLSKIPTPAPAARAPTITATLAR